MKIKKQQFRTIKVISDDKFKNNKITINFVRPLVADELSKRALLAELIGNGSRKYDSEQAVAKKLSNLYGASYGATVIRLGTQSILQVNITFPNDKYLPNQTKLLPEIIDFLIEMLYAPQVIDSQFEPHFFRLHQDNMIRYVNSIQEDHAYDSIIALRKLFYDNQSQYGDYILGSKNQIEAVSSQSLFEYYQSVIENDAVIITTAGNLELTTIRKAFLETPLAEYMDASFQWPALKVPYQVHGPRKQVKKYEGDQTILTMGAYLPIYLNDMQYFAALVGNSILGGSMQSLLFTNIREKESLAYDAHSTYDALEGRITIQTGIDAKNVERVTQLIKAQLKKLQTADYDKQLLTAAKKGLAGGRIAGTDYLRTLTNRALINEFKQNEMSEAQWQRNLAKVTMTDVADAFKKISIQAIYVGLATKGSNNERN